MSTRWVGKIDYQAQSDTVLEPRPDAEQVPVPDTGFGDPPVIERQRTLIQELLTLAEQRAQIEPRIDAEFRAQTAGFEEQFDARYQDAIINFAADKETIEANHAQARERISKKYDEQRARADQEYATAREEAHAEYLQAKQAIKSDFQETRWTITAVFDGNRNGADSKLHEEQQLLAAGKNRILSIRQETRAYLDECRLRLDDEPTGEAAKPRASVQEPFRDLEEKLSFADNQLTEIKALGLPRFFKGERPLWLFLGIWLLTLYPAWVMWGLVYGLAGSAVSVLTLGVVSTLALYNLSRSQARPFSQSLFSALRHAESLLMHCEASADSRYHRQRGLVQKRYNRELRQLTAKFRQRRSEVKERRLGLLRQAALNYQHARKEIKEQRTLAIQENDLTRHRLRKEIQEQYENKSRVLHERFEQQSALAKTRQLEAWNRLIAAWTGGMKRLHAEADEILREHSEPFPGWSDPAWDRWQPSEALPAAIRFGEYRVDLAGIPGGLPQHEVLRRDLQPVFILPALAAFPERCSLLIKAREEGRQAAVQVLQTCMFRLMTTIPPGKARFTILDPIGLGQNFASFMHLADFDEALVTNRIWTEQGHIEQRLADLTGHMEVVIQKYLRNQFPTIEEYNAHAGEVAEPYRILVVANFPANFTQESVRRLVSIVESGPRCGVYTLISVDTRQPMPQGFDLADLERPGVHLLWKDRRFVWEDGDFEPYRLQVDPPPPAELCTRLMRQVGEAARSAKRVEVPFEFVAPPRESWWTQDSRSGISVPLGRVGATKRQHLQLGQGTSQHVVIAGKTGSGKSTLLHALINNLALLYSPEEVELYLVDFKKGVEFKTYASHRLPHARVIAIESEREFGLSVLQRLDAELRQRAERYRAVGAQDVRSFREAGGNVLLPRILLIVDEFQEFFVEEDKIAQDAALLLDRLVRQGRAFGLHVLLGSQTLGGAYSLARSTLDQMAVRIALQCSENDAHVILSEDNSAARLLSRPGEAIYNDANGLVEGNNPFQVVWLDDDKREAYLNQINALFQARSLPEPAQIIFEGNLPAVAERNPNLSSLLSQPAWSTPSRVSQAWLGEAIAIKEPTAATFRNQSGNNLLIVGQQDESAMGMLAMALVSLAAQHSPRLADAPGTRFWMLDGSLEDVVYAGLPARLAGVLPHETHVKSWREVDEVMSQLIEEVERRTAAAEIPAPPLFLIVFGLQRFRDLRRNEDDFGMPFREGERPSPSQAFAKILREGPLVGVHTLVWCDGLTNVQRCLDRQSLREFAMLVLFQMSPADSSALIDTPIASKLGVHRALFYNEEQGRLEKFRPYGLPTEAWLQSVRVRLAAKENV